MPNDYYEGLTGEQKALIEKHLDLVIEANKVTNITRIDSKEAGRLLHIEDSLSALPEIKNAPTGKYIDLGSGGGFPGIPIAIATGRKTTLIDAREKKVDLLNQFAEQLGISDSVQAVHTRIEEFSRKHKYQYSLVTARALAKLSILMEFSSPLLREDGLLVCYKARLEEAELLHAKKVCKIVGMKYIGRRDFLLSDEETQRCIVVFKKVGNSTIKLPRKDGYAQKKPL